MDSEPKSKGQTNKIVIAIVAVLVLGLIGLGLSDRGNNGNKTSSNTQSSESSPESTDLQKTEYLSYQGEDGKTALELLKSQAETETKTSSIGEYVTSINGNDGGGSKFWMFYVDDKESSVGAAAYVTKSGETIEWKLK